MVLVQLPLLAHGIYPLSLSGSQLAIQEANMRWTETLILDSFGCASWPREDGVQLLVLF